MKLWVFLASFFCVGVLNAEQVKTIFNPFTGKLDYITVLSSSTLPSGSTHYIQNSFAPTTATQVFSVYQGKYDQPGFIMTDSANCTWNTTVATTGALTTSLISCPSAGGASTCSNGMSLGLLLSITCP